MERTVLLAQLVTMLDGEIDAVSRFITLLEEENQLLVTVDADALLEKSHEKNTLFQTLQRYHDTRSILLAREKITDNKEAIRDFFRQSPVLLEKWDTLLDLALQARSLNSLNGKLIHERMAHNQSLMALLLNAARQPQFYDAEGMTHPSNSGRHLGSA